MSSNKEFLIFLGAVWEFGAGSASPLLGPVQSWSGVLAVETGLLDLAERGGSPVVRVPFSSFFAWRQGQHLRSMAG